MDFEKIATETDDELKQLEGKWFAVLEQTDLTDPQNSFRTGLLRLAYSYTRLVVLSYGFQHAFLKGQANENPFLLRVSVCPFPGHNRYVTDKLFGDIVFDCRIRCR